MKDVLATLVIGLAMFVVSLVLLVILFVGISLFLANAANFREGF